ncbi:MAG: tetratricopeptide repeat protein [Sphingomonadales bacterium]|nr:MAG: tetratricopeptide repeat protein [Sphingomonadales bacterium]
MALTFSAIPAHAQSAPAPTSPAAGALTARVNDIQVARTGDTISILVKLSQQPAAATVKSTGETLTLDIDGLNLNTLNLTPPAGSLVTRVEAASGKLTLSGVAFSSPTSVIYRNAVMIEAKLAEATLPAATSLMGATIPAAPKPVAVSPAPAPIPVSAPAPVPAPVPVPVQVKEPAPAKPVEVQPAPPPAATPITPTPVALTLPPAASPKRETSDELQSHPAPAAPKPAAAAPAASMAGIDPARCSTASEELAKDAWALAAMGDHALCLIDAGKLDEAKNRLDQLAAITPQDWRVALGRATLAEKSGDTKTAQAAFVSASLAAPNDAIRVAITERISATPENKEADLELPLPTPPGPKAAH